MKLVFLIVAVFTLYTCVKSNPEEKWHSYKITHKKVYKNEPLRKEIFIKNLKFVTEHNEKYKAGKVTYKLGLNAFSDLEPKEFHVRAKGKLRVKSLKAINPEPRRLRGAIPETLDWRNKSLVSPIQNQGSVCGSCYSFAANGAVEGQIAKNKGKLINLSEQHVVDCSGAYGNLGCGGGLAENTYKFISAKGITLQKNYKYTGKKGTCKKVPNIPYKVTGVVRPKRGDEEDLKKTLAAVGPVAIALDASHMSLQFYKGGIYYEPKCKSGVYDLDHAVLLVGYGKSSKGDYWIIKNSWGSTWGNKGYLYLARNKKNHCGVASDITYPKIA